MAAKPATTSTLGQLFTFSFKAGSLTLQRSRYCAFSRKRTSAINRLAQWPRVFCRCRGGMLSPGVVVITATFVGYLVAGFWGSLVATVGIFLSSFPLILFVPPILIRHRENSIGTPTPELFKKTRALVAVRLFALPGQPAKRRFHRQGMLQGRPTSRSQLIVGSSGRCVEAPFSWI
jgi:hypothetical protein